MAPHRSLITFFLWFSGCGGARLNPPEKLFDEIINAKIALCAIAFESQRLQKF
jgi:hypothetical protein